jgi:hypothetical protein
MNTTAIIWNDEDAREPGQTKRVHCIPLHISEDGCFCKECCVQAGKLSDVVLTDVWLEKEVGMEQCQSTKDDIPQENDGVYSKELATQMLLQDASAAATTFCLST